MATRSLADLTARGESLYTRYPGKGPTRRRLGKVGTLKLDDGMSVDAKLRTAAGLSSAWDGEPIKRVRAADGVTVLAGRRLAVHLMAQPDVAAVMLNDPLLGGQGLLSRVLATAPDMSSGTRMWREPSSGTLPTIEKYRNHRATCKIAVAR
jgi:hypothetical protein